MYFGMGLPSSGLDGLSTSRPSSISAAREEQCGYNTVRSPLHVRSRTLSPLSQRLEAKINFIDYTEYLWSLCIQLI